MKSVRLQNSYVFFLVSFFVLDIFFVNQECTPGQACGKRIGVSVQHWDKFQNFGNSGK